jgi:DNA modification methylase
MSQLTLGGERVETWQNLQARYGVPPFSVLDSKQEYWQEKKRKWLSLGIESEVGRSDDCLGGLKALVQARAKYDGYVHKNVDDEAQSHKQIGLDSAQGRDNNLLGFSKLCMLKKANGLTGTSVFDPVLCELMYRWFCPPNGSILDPFAGGSVRGIIAAKMGYKYTGIELRKEQVDANLIQKEKLSVDCTWILGDSTKMNDLLPPEEKYDFVFSCPPYYDLEVYSQDPSDISTCQTYEQFFLKYQLIISKALARLRDDRFACFVVGDMRDKSGFYRKFHSHTINAFEGCGAKLYNYMILLNAIGTLPVRTSRIFPISRKVGKAHQDVLVFYKGNPKTIKEMFKEDAKDTIPEDEEIAEAENE